jgi:hypothetical protein
VKSKKESRSEKRVRGWSEREERVSSRRAKGKSDKGGEEGRKRKS